MIPWSEVNSYRGKAAFNLSKSLRGMRKCVSCPDGTAMRLDFETRSLIAEASKLNPSSSRSGEDQVLISVIQVFDINAAPIDGITATGLPD